MWRTFNCSCHQYLTFICCHHEFNYCRKQRKLQDEIPRFNSCFHHLNPCTQVTQTQEFPHWKITDINRYISLNCSENQVHDAEPVTQESTQQYQLFFYISYFVTLCDWELCPATLLSSFIHCNSFFISGWLFIIDNNIIYKVQFCPFLSISAQFQLHYLGNISCAMLSKYTVCSLPY